MFSIKTPTLNACENRYTQVSKTTVTDDFLVITEFNSDSYSFSIKLDNDGNIYSAGTAGGDFALVKYLPSGILDSTFGTNGIVITQLPNSEALSIELDTNGNIYLAGFSTNADSNNNFTLVKYLPSGAPDTTFGTDGIVITQLPGNSSSIARSIHIDTNTGDIYLGGRVEYTGFESTEYIALVKYDQYGNFITMGTAGLTNYDVIMSAMKVDSDGNIYLTGTRDKTSERKKTILVKFLPTCVLDTMFGTDGIIVLEIDSTSDVASSSIQLDTNNNNIYLAGNIGDTSSDGTGIRGFLIKLDSSGTPDINFGPGGNGIVVTGGLLLSKVKAIYLYSDDIYLMGFLEEESGTYVRMFKYNNSTGVIDTDFGTDGFFDGNGDIYYPFSIELDSNENIYLGGFKFAQEESRDFVLAKYTFGESVISTSTILTTSIKFKVQKMV
jgi:uncharacterized delta-60 repeat protein